MLSRKRTGAAAITLLVSGPLLAQPVDTAPAPAPAAPQGVPEVAQNAAAAPAKSLSVGDPAPSLTIAKWVKGERVEAFERGKVYVVEFWATWCPPCRQSVPHLTEIQREFRDRGVTVIGISSDEGAGLKDLEPFVKKMGDDMAYSVAWDNDGQTSRDWMRAADQDGIPTAFVVDQEGRVAWIGHPMDRLDAVLEKVVAKTFDIGKAAQDAKRRDEVQTKAKPLIQKAQEQFQGGEQRAALATFDQIIALDPKVMGEWAFYKFELMALEMQDYEGAYAFARQAVDTTLSDNAQILNALAWMIMDHPDLRTRDLPLARRAAERANTLTGDNDPGVMDTFARALFETGEHARAIELQRRAVELAKPGTLKDQLEQRLAEYREHAPKG